MSVFSWENKRVLVTGCTGLLGSWLTAALIERGASVIGLVRDHVPHSQLNRSGTMEKITVVHGSITDQRLLERTLAEYEIDSVFHLAAQTIVGIANRNPLSTFDANIRGTWLLLEAARRHPLIERVVVASSDKAYGDQPELPYHEDAPMLGQHPYDVSKSCTDLIARSYAHTYKMPVVVTRCGNLYGGGDLNWNRIIPGTIKMVLAGEAPLIRSDGSPQRDYVYIQDAVDGYLAIAEAVPEFAGHAFNLGLDQPASALAVVEKIIQLSDYPDLKPIIENRASNEIQHQYLSSQKAKELLGWEAKHSLEEGLQETIGWYRRFLHG